MPREIFGQNYTFLPPGQLLSFEEIARLARLFVAHGVGKIRLTGGEPLMRRDLEQLVAMLADLDGLEDLAMTTNGALLARKAQSLKAAGLRRVTVSLDALDDPTFKAMNDANFPVELVLEAIEAAAEAGLQPVKVNMVVKRGVNEHTILPMAAYMKQRGHVLRIIEYMDVGHSNGWKMDDVVPAAEVLERINAELPLVPAAPNYPGEVASRFRYRDGDGEVGVIASVTQPFCGACTRARLSSEGQLFTCLFATSGRDLRGPMRAGATDEQLAQIIASTWLERSDRYSELRTAATTEAPRVEMSYIGG